MYRHERRLPPIFRGANEKLHEAKPYDRMGALIAILKSVHEMKAGFHIK
jgi:hypothetical protein